jgi:hypothetical protein
MGLGLGLGLSRPCGNNGGWEAGKGIGGRRTRVISVVEFDRVGGRSMP